MVAEHSVFYSTKYVETRPNEHQIKIKSISFCQLRMPVQIRGGIRHKTTKYANL
jgi:hypothetical protein